jgi:hypothetical protein
MSATLCHKAGLSLRWEQEHNSYVAPSPLHKNKERKPRRTNRAITPPSANNATCFTPTTPILEAFAPSLQLRLCTCLRGRVRTYCTMTPRVPFLQRVHFLLFSCSSSSPKVQRVVARKHRIVIKHDPSSTGYTTGKQSPVFHSNLPASRAQRLSLDRSRRPRPSLAASPGR